MVTARFDNAFVAVRPLPRPELFASSPPPTHCDKSYHLILEDRVVRRQRIRDKNIYLFYSASETGEQTGTEAAFFLSSSLPLLSSSSSTRFEPELLPLLLIRRPTPPRIISDCSEQWLSELLVVFGVRSPPAATSSSASSCPLRR